MKQIFKEFEKQRKLLNFISGDFDVTITKEEVTAIYIFF